jgi:AcrR family transcriptional regulator
MSATRAYQSRGRQQRSAETREQITAAVRELLAEGTFHESTVEQVADRAGIARATLYQHFRSRLELVDAICDTFDANPALRAIRQSVEEPQPEYALAETIQNTIEFWSSEDAVLAQLYGVVGIDPAARDLVERQRNDRRGEMTRLADNLRKAAALPAGMTAAQALSRLMVLTSYETYRELTESGLSKRETAKTLQETARSLLLR